jgi:hypothetical protein
MWRPPSRGRLFTMRWTGPFAIAALLLCAGHMPARAMDLCEALDAAEETRAEVTGFVTAIGADSDYPYLFVEDETGECEILVEVVDKAMLANCVKESKVTAIGVLRWDEEAAYFEDIDVNLLDDASVVCE